MKGVIKTRVRICLPGIGFPQVGRSKLVVPFCSEVESVSIDLLQFIPSLKKVSQILAKKQKEPQETKVHANQHKAVSFPSSKLIQFHFLADEQ